MEPNDGGRQSAGSGVGSEYFQYNEAAHELRGERTGKRFRLAGKGMSMLRAKSRGDMYVQVSVETPQKLSKRQKELLREFDKESSKDNQPESAGFFQKMREFFE